MADVKLAKFFVLLCTKSTLATIFSLLGKFWTLGKQRNPSAKPQHARRKWLALVASSLAISQPGLAAAILLCFTGLLRCSEALALRWTDMIFTDNVVVLLLGQTKRGIDQKVVLSHPATCRWLLQYTLQFRRHMSDKVCPLSYSKMRYWLPKLCHSLKLDGLLLTSHSFRRGGASCLLHQGVALADIAVQGRWASESSCREYLRRGEMFVLRYQAAVKQEVWDNILLLAKSLFVLLPQCDSS